MIVIILVIEPTYPSALELSFRFRTLPSFNHAHNLLQQQSVPLLSLLLLYTYYYLTMIASAKKRVHFGELPVREFDRATMESAKKRVRFGELQVREFDRATMESAKKRVRFGDLRVREFDRATMGEHPLTRGGFALQLGQRYQDLPPVAIPNKERKKRGGKRRRPRHVHEPQRKRNLEGAVAIRTGVARRSTNSGRRPERVDG
jgi:hypothetical protein